MLLKSEKGSKDFSKSVQVPIFLAIKYFTQTQLIAVEVYNNGLQYLFLSCDTLCNVLEVRLEQNGKWYTGCKSCTFKQSNKV